MSRLLAALVAFYRREPVRANGLAASLVGVLLVRIGLNVTDADVLAAVGVVLPIVAAELTRRFVSPVAPTPPVPWAPPEDWTPENPTTRLPKKP